MGWQAYGKREYLGGETPILTSLDPLNGKFPELTPYQYASNRPIDGIDLLGMQYAPNVPIQNEPLIEVSRYEVVPETLADFKDFGFEIVPTTWSAYSGAGILSPVVMPQHYHGPVTSKSDGYWEGSNNGAGRYIPSKHDVYEQNKEADVAAIRNVKSLAGSSGTEINNNLHKAAFAEHITMCVAVAPSKSFAPTNSAANTTAAQKPVAALNPKPQKLTIPAGIPNVMPFLGHGNKASNTNPQMVYVFTFTPTDGKTPFIKFGIADIYKNIERPENQVARMQATYGASATWRVVTYTPNRAEALGVENDAVQQHKANWNGARPREQILPQ